MLTLVAHHAQAQEDLAKKADARKTQLAGKTPPVEQAPTATQAPAQGASFVAATNKDISTKAGQFFPRDSIVIELFGVPAARISCTLTLTPAKPTEAQWRRETKTLEWDPRPNTPLSREIRARSDADITINCGSEPLMLKDKDGIDKLLQYEMTPMPPEHRKPGVELTVDAGAAVPAGADAGTATVAETQSCTTGCQYAMTLRSSFEAAVDGGVAPTGHRLILRLLRTAVPAIDLLGESSAYGIATSRGIEPLSAAMLFNDAARAIVDVAVERAHRNAEQLIARRLEEIFCERLTLERLRVGGFMADWLPRDESGPLLPRTCDAVSGVRIQELAASAKIVEKALASDLLHLAFASLRNVATCDLLCRLRAVSGLLEHGPPEDGSKASLFSALRQASGLLVDDAELRRASKKFDAALGNGDLTEEKKLTAVRSIWREVCRHTVATLTSPIYKGSLGNLEYGSVLAACDMAKPKSKEVISALKKEASDLHSALESVEKRAAATPTPGVVAPTLSKREEDALALVDEREHLAEVLQLIETLSVSLLESRTTRSERDMQLLLLGLARKDGKVVSTAVGWRDALLVGSAILTECMAQGPCSADELKRALYQETSVITQRNPRLKVAFDDWPDLPLLLARAVDVLRPPPGTPSRATAKAALNIALDVVTQAIKQREYAQESLNAGTAEKMRLARELVNAIAGQDMNGTVQLSGALISRLISERCQRSAEPNNVCFTPANSASVKKWFGVLGAFVGYASSYRTENKEADTEEQRKQRGEDERKKAMNALLDAATDRSNRGRDRVWSIGVAVGGVVSGGRMAQTGDKLGVMGNVSLPIGFAYEVLPHGAGFGVLGFHLRATFLDVGQYLQVRTKVKDDGKGKAPDERAIAEPRAATSLCLGLAPGALIGGPSQSVLVGFDWGYAPWLDFRNDDSKGRGAWRFGGFVGTYISFLDFN
jgi:hypothetical protein